MLPKLNSAHGSETRNIINRAIEVLNVHGKTIQDLVAEGQLTDEQYANLITIVNGMVKSGKINKSDLSPELRNEIDEIETQLAQKPTYSTVWNMENMGQDVKESMTGGSVAVVGENSVQRINMSDNAVSVSKLDAVTTELIGLEKVIPEWVIGTMQSGAINSLGKDAVTINNYIVRNKPIVIKFSGNTDLEYSVFNYIHNDTYTGTLKAWNSDVESTINVGGTDKIRVSIRYKDKRLLTESDKYELLTHIDIFKDTDKSLNNIYKRIENLDSPNDSQLPMPTYWESHLDSKISTIKNHQQSVGWDGTSFVFITDVHWNSNAQKSPMILRKVVSECDVPYILDGGDFCANPGGVPKQEQLDEISEYRQAFSPLDGRILRTLGNHDDNSINGLFSETIIDSELYDAVYRQNSKYSEIVSGKTGKYHYIDDNMHKVRYITLDALDIPYVQTADDGLLYGGMTDWAFRQEQIDWFTSTALNVPSYEWGVVVVSHIPVNYGYIKNDNLVINALQAFKDKSTYTNTANTGTDFEASVNVDYSNGGGEVYCWLAGHVHLDMTVALPTNITFPQILTLNDNLHSKPEAPERIVGTTSEQAFDVITIDKVNRKLLFTRIGAGSDREFNY